MALVIAKVIGGRPMEMEATTVKELKEKLGLTAHAATVNGEAVEDSYELSENDFVSLAPAVKGALTLGQARYIASLADRAI